MNTIKIGQKEIGSDLPVFIIAEIGINHEGNIKLCEQMIRASADAGVDAVKLQTINADNNYVKGSESYNVFKGAELSQNETKEMFQLAESLDLEIFTTVGDFETLEWVKEMNPCAWKISSGLITHLPLIEKIAKFGKPALISTGLSDIDEIGDAVNTFYNNGNHQIGIFQCTSIYPVKPDDIYLSRIEELERIFDVPIGFSDHSLGSDATFLSIGIGAKMIEKHLTFDKSRKGYDHGISMDQKEIKILVEKVRLAERIKGKISISFKEFQKEKRKKMLRCIVAKKNIVKGELFTKENITIKRPLAKQRGLEPKYYYSIFNKVSNRNYSVDEPIIYTISN